MSVAGVSSYMAKIGSSHLTDADATLTSIRTFLPEAIKLHDYDRAYFYVRGLVNYCEQLLPIADEQRCTLVTDLLRLLTAHRSLPLHIQLRALEAAAHILKAKHIPALVINWRTLYHLIQYYHVPSDRTFPSFSAQQTSNHSQQLVRVVTAARRYFSPEAPTEIYETFAPYVVPFNDSAVEPLALLSLFLPTFQPDRATKTAALLTRLTPFQMMADRSAVSALPFFLLYARISKHAIASFDLLDRLPALFSSFLQLLELDVGGQSLSNISSAKPQHSRQQLQWLSGSAKPLDTLCQCMAKIVVYTLHIRPKENERSSHALLAQLLHTIQTYFYPSNTGHWTQPLAVFLTHISQHYSKRRGRERRGDAAYEQKFYIPSDDTAIVSTIMPIALQALFAKHPSMVQAAESFFRDVGRIHPSLVLPPLVRHIYPALEDLSSPHRMLSIMQTLSTLAPLLLNRHLYPQGAAHLERLLWNCLPGIDAVDPAKTGLTLTFFTIVFYNIPFIDARSTTSTSPLNELDAPRPAVSEKSMDVVADDDLVGGNDMSDGEDPEDEARRATMRFEEWALTFLQSLFSLLSSLDKFAKKDAMDVYSARLLLKVTRAFFHTLSPSIYAAALDKLMSAVLQQHSPNAAKQWGIFLTMAALASPRLALEKMIPSIFRRIVDTKTTPQLNTLAHDDLRWNIYLLSCAVKLAGGAGAEENALIPHANHIQTVYDLTRSHSDKGVRKSSGKLLRNMLRALTNTYPAEWRNFDPELFNEWKRWQHWNQWAAYKPQRVREEYELQLDDIPIVWHIPTNMEIVTAQQLLIRNAAAPIRLLVNFIGEKPLTSDVDSAPQGKGDGPIERALAELIHIVRGCGSVLGDIDGLEQKPDDKSIDTTRCPLVNINAARPITPLSVPPLLELMSVEMEAAIATSSLRTHLLRLTHGLVARLLDLSSGPTSTQPSLKSVTSIIKLIVNCLENFGFNAHKLSGELHIGNYTRKRMTEYVSGFRLTMRPVLVQQAFDYHALRSYEQHYHQPYTVDVENALMDLSVLAVNDFAKVRDKASAALSHVLRRFPLGIDLVLKRLTRTLSDSVSSDDAILGVFTVLSDSAVVAWTTRKWNRLLSVVSAAIKYAGNFKDDKVQILVQSYFTRLFPSLSPLPVHIPLLHASDGSLDRSLLEKRNESIVRYSTNMASTYQSLIRSLLDSATDNALHWRYQLMSAALMYALIRTEELSAASASPSYHDITLYYLRALHSDSSPIRKVSIAAINRIVGSHIIAQRRAQSNQISQMNTLASSSGDELAAFITPILDESVWLQTAFLDDVMSSGWSDAFPPNQTRYYRSADSVNFYGIHRSQKSPFVSLSVGAPLADETVAAIIDSAARYLDKFINAIVTDHSSANSNAPSNEPSRTRSDAPKSSGAGETISQLAYSHWPHRRHNAVPDADAFDYTHMNLIRGLVEMSPNIAVADGALYAHIDRLTNVANDADKDYVCAAAEIIAGIVNAATHMTVKLHEQIISAVAPVLMNVLASSQPDNVPLWSQSLYCVYARKDPRRLAWLNRLLIHDAFASLPSMGDAAPMPQSNVQPAILFKRFRYILPLMTSSNHLTAPLGGWILQRFHNDHWLDFPYKQVRAEISHLLAAITANSFKLNGAGPTAQLVPFQPLIDFLAKSVYRLNEMEKSLYRSKHKEASTTPAQVVADGGAPDKMMSNGEKSSADDSRAGTLFLETHLTYFSLSMLSNDIVQMGVLYQTLLPHVIQSQHVTDSECAAMGKAAAQFAAWKQIKGATAVVVEADAASKRVTIVVGQSLNDANAVLDNVFNVIQAIAIDPTSSWHVRASCLAFLRVLIPRHCMQLTLDQVNRLETLITDRLLIDHTVEVRDSAQATLTALISSCLSHPSSSVVGFTSSRSASDHIIKLQHKLIKRIRSSKKNKDSTNSQMLAQRHGAVLGLVALVNAHPYDLPIHIPEVLATLAKFVGETAPISSAIRKVFADFMRTHADEWNATFKAKFSDEQLEAISAVQSAPTYFA